MENRDYIVAIDLGDSNIVVAVGSAAEGGRINVDHILSRPSEGVSAGQIVNIDLAVKCIRTTLQELKDTTGIEVLEAYAGISGEFIYCTSHTDHVFVPDHKNGVTKQVVDALFERMGNVMVSEDRSIMERIPQRYVINDTTEVDDPVGVFGSPLSSTFNFISSDSIPLSRLDMALRRLNIAPRRIFSNAVVVGNAVLSADEKEEGVIIVDLGGELTDLAIYHRNIVRYISTIPIGAKAFNNDIRTLSIPERYIEPLKLKYGRALSKNAPQDLTVIIKGRSKHDQREIAVFNLAAVIEARARDIAELVRNEINDSGFADKIPYGIVLTGGSAQLHSLDELFREVTGLEVRVAEAEDIVSPQTRTKITSSADSTAVGLLLHGLKYGPCAVNITEPIAPPAPAPQQFQQRESVAPAPVAPSPTPAPQPRVIPTPAPQPQPSAAAPQQSAPKVTTVVEEEPPRVQPRQIYTPPVQNQAPRTILSVNETYAQRAAAQQQSTVSAALEDAIDDEEEELPEAQTTVQADVPETPKAEAPQREKPKGRMMGILNKLNTLVNNVNSKFETGNIDEEV